MRRSGLRVLTPVAVALLLGTALCFAAFAAARDGGVAQATRALATAQQKMPNARPYDLERERFRGASAWEIKVAAPSERKVKVYVALNGRRVLGSRRDGRWGRDARVARAAKVSMSRAIRIAARNASGRLVEADIDRERGRDVWCVTFRDGRTETEVAVDTTSGAVVEVDIDDD